MMSTTILTGATQAGTSLLRATGRERQLRGRMTAAMRRSFDYRDFPAARVSSRPSGAGGSRCACRRATRRRPSVRPSRLIRQGAHGAPPASSTSWSSIDDGSTDDTAAVAEAAGASVVAAAEVLPEYGTEHGKGQAMWRAVHVTSGDLVVFCDADIRDFDAGFVLGLRRARSSRETTSPLSRASTNAPSTAGPAKAAGSPSSWPGR